jgi:hypothetical protein
LSFAILLINSIRGFKFFTPDMKIGGGFGSLLFLASSSIFSSESVLKLLVGDIVPPSLAFWRFDFPGHPKFCVFFCPPFAIDFSNLRKNFVLQFVVVLD